MVLYLACVCRGRYKEKIGLRHEKSWLDVHIENNSNIIDIIDLSEPNRSKLCNK